MCLGVQRRADIEQNLRVNPAAYLLLAVTEGQYPGRTDDVLDHVRQQQHVPACNRGK